ncbi:PadR family transcriptional regulator [Knoellia koreensis]|uniref:PadR family transcriptional regulator n=1 Tax=Knoellia koreensis TaxID=2730921 RepID=A0A849HA08_9MICO|nr:PadR family transcriptional regulator [Knoellia sp. DB2414S]NNM46700.1 PadR family transcriptional regulator [Knoellia sp. DB2414S]
MPPEASIPSHLGFAILGLLARRQRTGYDIAKAMERPVGYFWTARHSQIYPELARLEDAGLVRHRVVDGAGPRPTKRYAVTAAGKRALRSWVASELEPQPVRDLETLKLWSVWLVAPEIAKSFVRQSLSAHKARLAAYEEELAGVDADTDSRDPGHPLFASRLTLEGGVRSRRAAVEWCEWMLDELDWAGDHHRSDRHRQGHGARRGT